MKIVQNKCKYSCSSVEIIDRGSDNDQELENKINGKINKNQT